MPVTTDTLRNMKRVNVVFAASAFLTLISTLWMFKHDYERPWRNMQRGFFNLRSAFAHFDALAFETPEMKEKHQKLKQAVDDANQELARDHAKKYEQEKLKEEKELSGKLQGAQLTFGNLNAEMQVRLFNYEEALTLFGSDDPRTEKILKDNEEAEKLLNEARSTMDTLDDQLRAVRDDLKKHYARRTQAEKALALFEKDLNDARRFDEMYGPGITRLALNAPLMDYLAPKGVPGREEVKQVFSKAIRFDYNFVDSYVTDRCVTCHVGIDDPTLTLSRFVQRTETALKAPGVIDVLKRENTELNNQLALWISMAGLEAEFAKQDVSEMDPALREKFIRTLISAANNFLEEHERPLIDPDAIVNALASESALTRKKITDVIDGHAQRILWGVPPRVPGTERPMPFDEMSERDKITHVASLTAAMNMYLEEQGRPRIDFSKELRAHPKLDLYVSPDSPHPMKKMGCTVCHEGAGQDTDFILAAHTPKNKHEQEEWEKKYYTKELGIPLATFHLVEEFWERPMLLPDYTSASCRKCHSQTYDLENYNTLPLPSAHRVVEGRDLFTTVGCINCHNVEGLSDYRQVGTDLSHVGEKLSQGFMERWIEYPKNFRPSTWMPAFFHQENNLPSSANEFDPDPVLRTETEIQAIAHYLRTFTKPITTFEDLPKDMPGDPARGEELFASIGCFACHVNLDAKDALSSDGVTLAESWIVRDLEMRDGLSADDAKARFGAMTKNDRVRYAVQHFTTHDRAAATARAATEEYAAEKERRDPDPRRMYIPPAFTRIGPELSGIGTKLIDDPSDAAQVDHGRKWLYNWLREPRHYSSYTKMPRLFRQDYYQLLDPATQDKQTKQDLLDVTEYLLSLRNDEFNRQPFPNDARHREETERLILMLLVGQNTSAVSKMILNDQKFDPSDAQGRLSAAIVAQAAKSFGDGDEGKRRVSEIIDRHSGSLADRQKLYLGMKMITHYGCNACHTIAGFEDATRPGTDLSLWAQKFMSQLDFAFYSPAFEHEIEEQPDVFGKVYIEDPEYQHLIRDIGGNSPQQILHNHASFAYHKLKNPRIWDRAKLKKPYEKLKMPNFSLSDEEAKSLTTYLLSMRAANVSTSAQVNYSNTREGRIAAGRSLVRELNCIGCHTIEGNEANIHQYYSKDTSLPDTDPRSDRFKPPLLWGEGAKVQHDWLYSFLNNVEMLRPWLKVRMPSFYLTSEQATTLVAYFAALSQDEAAILNSNIDPVVRYLQMIHTGNQEPAPAEAWFIQDRLAPQAKFLAEYAVAHKQVRNYDVDPGESAEPAAMAETLKPGFETILRRSEFLAGVFNVGYPFSDPISHATNDDRFKRGEEFLYDQKCLSCHVAGDPKAPGTTTDIKAPNFALTHKRLRYDWVIKWLQDPQAIQPGANMPQIFQGGSAFAGLPDDQRKAKEEQFGDTVAAQSTLLVDFLFNLGARNYTAVQPGGLAPPAATSQPAEGEFDFDSEGEKPKEKEADFDF